MSPLTHLSLYISLRSQIPLFQSHRGERTNSTHDDIAKSGHGERNQQFFSQRALHRTLFTKTSSLCDCFCLNARFMALVRKLLISHSEAQKKTTVHLKSTAYLHIKKLPTTASTNSRLAGFFSLFFICNPRFSVYRHSCMYCHWSC